MNLSVKEDAFEKCQIFGDENFVITKLPSQTFFINHTFAIVFNSILTIITVLLNGVAIVAILKSSQLYKKPCYFIILLQSVFDFAVGILGIPLFVVFLVNGIGLSNCVAARLALRSTMIPIGISSITLSAMTMERYIAIIHPYAYTTQVTRKRLLIYVVSGVILTFGVIILSFNKKDLMMIFAAVKSTVILFFIALAYIRIYSIIKKSQRSRNKLHDEVSKQNVSKWKLFIREIKMAKSCLIYVVCFFVLCFLPGAIVIPFHAIVDEYEFLAIKIWVFSLAFLNSSVNSVVFFWTKTMLRREAVKTMNTLCQAKY